jgi:hypothetical protein
LLTSCGPMCSSNGERACNYRACVFVLLCDELPLCAHVFVCVAKGGGELCNTLKQLVSSQSSFANEHGVPCLVSTTNMLRLIDKFGSSMLNQGSGVVISQSYHVVNFVTYSSPHRPGRSARRCWRARLRVLRVVEQTWHPLHLD